MDPYDDVEVLQPLERGKWLLVKVETCVLRVLLQDYQVHWRDRATPLPKAFLIVISHAVATLTKTKFLLSEIASYAALESVEIAGSSHHIRICVSSNSFIFFHPESSH